jgi:DNA recombination protein RmuC
MEVLLLIVLVLLVGGNLVLTVLLLRRPCGDPQLAARLGALAEAHERAERSLRDELVRVRAEAAVAAEALRAAVERQLATMSDAGERRAETLRSGVESRLEAIRGDTGAKLEQIRLGVEERLTGMLEQRLGQSFAQVAERLEQVHRGLGEMQALAAGVGDLRRVLANVKTRGTWGEVQLGALLEQLLAPAQFARDVQIRPTTQERVEFAIRLPGREDENEVWLPLDAKFPQEDYLRLVEAAEAADPAAVEAASKALAERLTSMARTIRDAYIHPPHSTDFAIMDLPTEGLYAEAVRRPGLVETLQREHRVVVAGPTTLAALVNSLQMGFRTLAIQKRAGEVWQVLAAVKGEFGKFGEVLDKLHRKLTEAAGTVEDATHRSRQMEKRLRKVEALPDSEAQKLLDLE